MTLSPIKLTIIFILFPIAVLQVSQTPPVLLTTVKLWKLLDPLIDLIILCFHKEAHIFLYHIKNILISVLLSLVSFVVHCILFYVFKNILPWLV